MRQLLFILKIGTSVCEVERGAADSVLFILIEAPFTEEPNHK